MSDQYLPPYPHIPTEHGKYINFFTDFAFKKLLGPPRKRQLMDFLNSVLSDLKAPITHIEYLQQEQLGYTDEDRDAIFDLFCETQNGDRIIVELQNSDHQNFKDRAVYYTAHPIRVD